MKSQHRAFSLVEVLLTLVVVAVLATVAVLTVNRVFGDAREQKLVSDADTLNRAVMAYVASGGDVSAFSTPDEVLGAMKRSSTSGNRTVGLAGAVIDPRIEFVPQSQAEGVSDDARIHWNPTRGRFEIVRGGGIPGIAAVTLSNEAVPAAEEESDRKNPVLYAKESTWIWDYQEKEATVAGGPSPIPVSDAPDSSTPPVAPPPPPGPPSATPLDPPLFSLPTGNYPATDFPLALKLRDPNPAGAGMLYYSVDYGNWVVYSGPISVAAGAVIGAQVLPKSDAYTSSGRVEQIYRILRLPLSTPVIQLSATEFTDDLETIVVRIANPNASDISTLHYALTEPGAAPPGRSNWVAYAGEFSVDASRFPAGFDVHAYARSVDPNIHIDSASARKGAGANFTFSDAGTGEVLYVIDASGSMDTAVGSSTRFQLVQRALSSAISRLRPSAKFSVVTFAGDILWTSGFGGLLGADEITKLAVIKQVGLLSTDHGTNYEAALKTPLLFPTKPKLVYFLTDGEPTGGGAYTDEVDALVSAGIKVNTIGVDLKDMGRNRLEEIAIKTGGTASVVSTK